MYYCQYVHTFKHKEYNSMDIVEISSAHLHKSNPFPFFLPWSLFFPSISLYHYIYVSVKNTKLMYTQSICIG